MIFPCISERESLQEEQPGLQKQNQEDKDMKIYPNPSSCGETSWQISING